MSKRDLAYVLVKLSGYSWIVLAVFSSIGHLITMIGAAYSHRQPSYNSYEWIATAVIEIILAVVIIKKAAKITDWLLRDDKT